MRSERWILAAIVAVVLAVSLPRFRALGVHQNELDAMTTLRLLGEGPLSARSQRLASQLEADSFLRRRLPDVEVLRPDLLRRHGYLFERVETHSGPELRAWPWKHGETGLAAFVLTPDRVLHGNPNANATWSGLSHGPGSSFTEPDWREVPARRVPADHGP